MTDYTDLHRDIVRALESISELGQVQQRYNMLVTQEIDKLWTELGELRDDVHLLFRAHTTEPAELAEVQRLQDAANVDRMAKEYE
jgi:phage terminase Nu1 subunit (DNA packaging protein)